MMSCDELSLCHTQVLLLVLMNCNAMPVSAEDLTRRESDTYEMNPIHYIMRFVA